MTALTIILVAWVLASAVAICFARARFRAGAADRHQDQLLAWLNRPLPPAYDAESTRGPETDHYTWGQYYAGQVADGLPPRYSLNIGLYLDDRITSDALLELTVAADESERRWEASWPRRSYG